MKNSCILFDLDGTLSDSSEGIYKSIAYALEKKGIIVEDLKVLQPFIGPPLRDSFQQYYHMTVEEVQQSYKVFQERYGTLGKFENVLYPGIKELLAALVEAGYLLGVATSKPELYTKEILEYFQIIQYFSVIKGASMDGSLSRKVDILSLAVEECKLKNPNIKELFMIGDRSFDMEAARELGCIGIGVTYGFGSESELNATGAKLICHNAEELAKLFL